MSKFEMKGYPSHHTGTQPKSLSNPIRFGMRAGEEDYTKFNPLQPFGNSAWGGVFSARGEYNAANKGKSSKPKTKEKSPEYTVDPNQTSAPVTSSVNAPSSGGTQVQGASSSNFSSSYSWP